MLAHTRSRIPLYSQGCHVFGDHTVNQQNLGTEIEEAPRERGADEAQPASDDCPNACVDIKHTLGADLILAPSSKADPKP